MFFYLLVAETDRTGHVVKTTHHHHHVTTDETPKFDQPTTENNDEVHLTGKQISRDEKKPTRSGLTKNKGKLSKMQAKIRISNKSFDFRSQ